MAVRIIVTIFITVFIVMFVFANIPNTNTYLDKFGKINILKPKTPTRNITFSVDATAQINTKFTTKSSDITFKSVSLSLSVGSGKFEGARTVEIKNFTGTGTIDGNSLILDGKSLKLTMTDIGVSFDNSQFGADANISMLHVTNVQSEKITLSNMSGTVKVRDTEIKTSGSLEIADPEAEIELSERLKINGTASAVNIPELEAAIK